jgi:peptidyl-tRNA hydrolase, PTH2 family
MPPGKMAAQAGHAFVESFLKCKELDPNRALWYRADGIGTKIVLEATLEEILELQKESNRLGYPSSLIVDSGHVMPPHFTGAPIITALGIGPLYRSESQLLSKFPLVK